MVDTIRTEGRGQRSEEVASHLRDMIAAGTLSVGGPVRETELSERLGVSRTPLREAFKMLAMEGLMTLLPNRGAEVTRMSLKDVEDVIQLLGALEALAAELACARITDAEVDAIASLHGQMVQHYRREELQPYFRLNQEIHQAIIDASGNHALSAAYRSHSNRIRRFRYAGNQRHARWDRAISEHEQILSALSDRDGPLLQQLLNSHLRNGWVVAKEMIRDEFEPADA